MIIILCTVLDSPIVIFIRKDLFKCSVHGEFHGMWYHFVDKYSICLHNWRISLFLFLALFISRSQFISFLLDYVDCCLCWNSCCLPNENIEYWFNCPTNLYSLCFSAKLTWFYQLQYWTVLNSHFFNNWVDNEFSRGKKDECQIWIRCHCSSFEVSAEAASIFNHSLAKKLIFFEG